MCPDGVTVDPIALESDWVAFDKGLENDTHCLVDVPIEFIICKMSPLVVDESREGLKVFSATLKRTDEAVVGLVMDNMVFTQRRHPSIAFGTRIADKRLGFGVRELVGSKMGIVGKGVVAL